MESRKLKEVVGMSVAVALTLAAFGGVAYIAFWYEPPQTIQPVDK